MGRIEKTDSPDHNQRTGSCICRYLRTGQLGLVENKEWLQSESMHARLLYLGQVIAKHEALSRINNICLNSVRTQ